MSYEKKYNSCKVLDVDTTGRQVKVAMAELKTIDRDKEVFDKKAFDLTIQQNGPKGTNEIWHLLDHDSKSFSALSKFKEVYVDGDHVVGVSQYKDSFAWREVAWPLYESGDFTQHSVGFTTMRKQKSSDNTHTIIQEVRLWEGSAVLWGANPNTPTQSVMKSFKELFDDAELSTEEIFNNRFERLIKRIKDDKFSEVNKNLLLIELMQLQSSYKAPTASDLTNHAAGGNEVVKKINFSQLLQTN